MHVDGFHMRVLRVYVALKTPKTSGVIVVSSGLGRIGNPLKIRKIVGYVKHWKVENFLNFQLSLAHDSETFF